MRAMISCYSTCYYNKLRINLWEEAAEEKQEEREEQELEGIAMR